MTELQIYHTRDSGKHIPVVRNILEKTYNITISNLEELEIPENYYNQKRGQCDASLLLGHLLRIKSPGLAMWIVDRDVFIEGMNFVFGCSSKGNGAVLSVNKLDSQSMIEKEAVHEIGHVLGLEHCKNYCAMEFSNSVLDAKMKPTKLCAWCRDRLRLD